MSGRLEGKVAFITGAARGLGRSHAVRLAEEGADIIGLDIGKPVDGIPYGLATSDDLQETARLVETKGRRIFTAACDVRDLDHLTRILAEGVAKFGRLDIVSANAGVLGPFASAENLPPSGWATSIDINLTGTYNTARASIPHIKRGGRGGSIVLTSSMAGLRPFVNSVHYVAAKHGVNGLMKALALELAPELIRVNSIHPAQTNTPMVQNAAMYSAYRPDLDAPTKADFEAVSRAGMAMPIPWVEPVDISNALVFLVSDEARYITGQMLSVDGGANLL